MLSNFFRPCGERFASHVENWIYWWGSYKFGMGIPTCGDFVSNPALFIFGFPIYLYALCIVTGMCVAMLVAAKIFKKRGYDPYDITIYCLIAIPMGILGARLYTRIFPWSGQSPHWETFFNIRDGGLGIYGGIMLGMATTFITSKVRKQDFRIVADAIMPGVMIAQSIGRWGNFFNQEAYGRVVEEFTGDLSTITFAEKFKYFPYAVFIDFDTTGELAYGGSGWFQATFFYESLATFIGFLIIVLWLNRSKHYKLGWNAVFYGIYYGTVRLIIEGMRTDSLYLFIGSTETDIRISQLVSIFAILFGIWNITKIYRKNLHAWYRKLFASEKQEVCVSRYVLVGVSVLLIGVSALLFVQSSLKNQILGKGGESLFIAGTMTAVVGIYALLGVFATNDRLKLYCDKCGKRCEVENGAVSKHDGYLVSARVFAVVTLLLVIFTAMSLLGIEKNSAGKITNPNNIVLAVCLIILAGASGYRSFSDFKLAKETPDDGLSHDKAVCDCGEVKTVKLNKFLLFVFPFKVYLDYGVENLKEWVEPVEAK